MRILVGGGSGFIGSHLRRLLEHHGHEMINVTRNVKRTGEISWDTIVYSGIPEKIDGVVNLAGVNIASPVRWSEQFKQELTSSRIDTTHILCNAIKKSEKPPKVYIGSSAIGYYGSKDKGMECTEDSPPGEGFFADLCQQWEAAVNLEQTDVRKVIVRIGLAIARDSNTIKSMYWPFFFGVGGTLGNGKQWFPWVHALDIASLILYSIENDKVSGVLNGVAPESVTNAEFTKTFARTMWRFAPFFVPGGLINSVLGQERGEVMTSSPKIVPKRTLETGYEFIYSDLKLACRDCVQWGSYDMQQMKH